MHGEQLRSSVEEWREREQKGLSRLYVLPFSECEIELTIRYAFRKDLVSEHLLLVVVKGLLIDPEIWESERIRSGLYM
jgi:hypothetical protein